MRILICATEAPLPPVNGFRRMLTAITSELRREHTVRVLAFCASDQARPATNEAMVMDAVAGNKFYIFSHPHALSPVQTRLEDIMLVRNPSDPFKDRPHIGQSLRDAIRAVD